MLGCYVASVTLEIFHLSFLHSRLRTYGMSQGVLSEMPYIVLDENNWLDIREIPEGLFHNIDFVKNLLDIREIPKDLFHNIDFVNTVCLCVGLSMLTSALPDHFLIIFFLNDCKAKQSL